MFDRSLAASIKRSVAESNKPDSDSQANDERVEELAKELADRLRAMPNRQELTDYAVSLLKDAGIPQAAVQELIGHDSEQMSALYTHVGREALEKAAAALPEI